MTPEKLIEELENKPDKLNIKEVEFIINLIGLVIMIAAISIMYFGIKSIGGAVTFTILTMPLIFITIESYNDYKNS